MIDTSGSVEMPMVTGYMPSSSLGRCVANTWNTSQIRDGPSED